jgi:hypothetical protein
LHSATSPSFFLARRPICKEACAVALISYDEEADMQGGIHGSATCTSHAEGLVQTFNL